MKFFTNLLISIFAISLTVGGFYLAMNDKPVPSGMLLGFGFLFVVLLILAKFKRFKGFGFEAELWEDKQIEAAELVNRLRLISVSVAEQVVLISSKLGLWDSGFSFPEMANLLEQANKLLEASGIPETNREDILNPIYKRIELNYWHAARNAVSRALDERANFVNMRNFELMKKGKKVDPENSDAADIEHDKQILVGISFESFRRDGSLKDLVEFALNSKSLSSEPKSLHEIKEIDLDFEYFRAKRSFRRVVNLIV